jgi:hypothetical protein
MKFGKINDDAKSDNSPKTQINDDTDTFSYSDDIEHQTYKKVAENLKLAALHLSSMLVEKLVQHKHGLIVLPTEYIKPCVDIIAKIETINKATEKDTHDDDTRHLNSAISELMKQLNIDQLNNIIDATEDN